MYNKKGKEMTNILDEPVPNINAPLFLPTKYTKEKKENQREIISNKKFWKYLINSKENVEDQRK